MTRFTIRYSGRGTKVLRTETLTAADMPSAMAQAKRRLKASQTFREARVIEDEDRDATVQLDRREAAVTDDESARP